MDRKLAPVCRLCRGSGWLCEVHPAQPWDHDDDCDGAGVACSCNEHALMPHADVFVDHDRPDSQFFW
ncbi:MAG: hypothetical protein U1E89_16690 [Burkholderiaceae bacterium]